MDILTKAARWMFVICSVMLAAGCSTGPASPDHQTIAYLADLEYPAEAPYGENLDIIAVKDGFHLRLVNRTAKVYYDLQLWLNQQYVREVDRIEIGDRNSFHLDTFINSHGESFPLGKLLTPEKAIPVVLAECYEPVAGVRHRMVVQPTSSW